MGAKVHPVVPNTHLMSHHMPWCCHQWNANFS